MLRILGDERHVRLLGLRPLDDANELTHHLLSAIHAHVVAVETARQARLEQTRTMHLTRDAIAATALLGSAPQQLLAAAGLTSQPSPPSSPELLSMSSDGNIEAGREEGLGGGIPAGDEEREEEEKEEEEEDAYSPSLLGQSEEGSSDGELVCADSHPRQQSRLEHQQPRRRDVSDVEALLRIFQSSQRPEPEYSVGELELLLRNHMSAARIRFGRDEHGSHH